ncbi:MAG TPA: asparagine--tRNA ligase [Fibrobacteraceae bacterium]|nr:asparagine--tRNA ligase [Fibrobacteraceae bacterium]
MYQEILIRDLFFHIDESVSLAGWAWNVRGSGKVQFLRFRDGSGFIQVVAGALDVPAEDFETLRHMGQESSVRVIGKVVKNDKAPGGLELLASRVQLVSATHDYPIGPKEHGVDFLMDQRHLWLRSPRQQAILRIRHHIIRAIRDYFDDGGFTLVDSPIFTPNECEGSSTLFATDYFEHKAFLSQSGQLYAEASCMAVGRAYCFGPTFRAENSNTRRHLTEFWMVEPEVAYMDLDGDMNLAQGLVQAIVNRVLSHCRQELALLERDVKFLEEVVAGPFPRLSYDEAVRILQGAGVDFQWGDDFGGADETIISEKFARPVIVHNYPTAIKPFYMKRSPDPRTVENMDILAPEGYGEIIGGSQREENLDVMLAAMAEAKLNPADYQWYLDLRRYGSVPHSGFGLGVERTVAWLCKLPHVRETVPFPRLPNRLKP